MLQPMFIFYVYTIIRCTLVFQFSMRIILIINKAQYNSKKLYCHFNQIKKDYIAQGKNKNCHRIYSHTPHFPQTPERTRYD